MLDRREAEVRQGLARISSAEQNLFASIEGRSQEETDDPDESGGLSQLRQASSVDMLGHEAGPGMTGPLLPLRVKAWAELYLADSSDPPPPILAAAGPESGALLLDGYENTWRRKPDKLFCLAIPPLSPAPPGGGWNNYLAARNNFREAVLDNLEYFAALLKDTALSAGAAPGSRDKVSMLPAYISSWQDRLQDHFLGPAQNSQELEFYSFPGVSLAELLQQLFHLQGPVAANKQERPTGILAILIS